MSNPTVHYLLKIAYQRLAEAGCDTPRLDGEVLLGHALQQERTWLYANFNTSIAPSQLNLFDRLLQRREQREPVAYLVGHKEFYGLEFEVSSAVLIPRPETELLIETALKIPKNPKSSLSIVDVGTGSGCLAITLAKHLPMASISAIDISPDALQIARQNATRHHVNSQIIFYQGDLLQPIPHAVEMIVSNPPYLSRAELITNVYPEVGHYEPALALVGGEDGLAIIRQLLIQAKEKLKPNGTLLVEIGFTQGQAVAQLAQAHFPNDSIEIKQDLAGLDRLLVVGH